MKGCTVPGPGSVSGIEFAGAGTRFVVLGPFASGLTVGTFGVSLLGTGLGTPPDGVLFAASLGPSDDASQEALDSGVPVVTRSNRRIGRTPAIEIGLDNPGPFLVELPVGRVVGAGGLFLVAAVDVSAAGAFGFVTFWADGCLGGKVQRDSSVEVAS